MENSTLATELLHEQKKKTKKWKIIAALFFSVFCILLVKTLNELKNTSI